MASVSSVLGSRFLRSLAIRAQPALRISARRMVPRAATMFGGAGLGFGVYSWTRLSAQRSARCDSDFNLCMCNYHLSNCAYAILRDFWCIYFLFYFVCQCLV